MPEYQMYEPQHSTLTLNEVPEKSAESENLQ